jgi:hypothetical protein
VQFCGQLESQGTSHSCNPGNKIYCRYLGKKEKILRESTQKVMGRTEGTKKGD